MDIRLYNVIEEMYLNIDGEDGENVYTFKPGKQYFLRFGDFSNGGWPQIYIPEYEDWYDIVLVQDEDGNVLKDDCGVDIYMVIVPEKVWKESYYANEYKKLINEPKEVTEDNSKRFEFWDLCDKVEKVFVELNIDVNQLELADMVYNLVNSSETHR